jgi:hypothetical protein
MCVLLPDVIWAVAEVNGSAIPECEVEKHKKSKKSLWSWVVQKDSKADHNK